MKLRDYIKNVVYEGDDSKILYKIDSGRIKPSKRLQDTIVGMLESNLEFNLIDDQKVVFERIMELWRDCEQDGKKWVLIAQGGPGTGRTVIAINLLARLTQEGAFAQYCSKNSAPRNVYARKLKGHRTKSAIDCMFKGSGSYVDSPEEMRQKVVERNAESNRSRALAGYCWNWPTKGRADSSVHEIQIGDFEMSWNLAGGEDFAIDPNLINEAGCIHTTQGLEFEYVGVIIGDDLRYEDGDLVTDFTMRAKIDKSIHGLKRKSKEEPERANKLADEIIKNTYRTLMTRGMRGCYVYATNLELREDLHERAEGVMAIRSSCPIR